MARFKTRARTVDMLGRQQIAGIPTAISELFKNAHDAYADHVEVDYFAQTGLFVLRDDGVGMSMEDFEQRWLTIGTESKLNLGQSPAPLLDVGAAQTRPVLGEKGIGRLAIGAIGPQVLVLTRQRTEDSSAPLIAAFIHWGLFRLPGIDLDQIEIPTRIFADGALPSRSVVLEMVSEAKTALSSLPVPSSLGNLWTIIAAEIQHDMDLFLLDPVDLSTKLNGLRLNGEGGAGTHFLIYPCDESVAAAIERPSDDSDVAAPLLKMLIGFTNTMTPNHSAPVIQTAFRHHKADDLVEDVINESVFFTPEEFENADHHIEGLFDDHGQFSGTVTVYGQATKGYSVAWPPARGKQSACGRFRINLAVVQGVPSQSTVPDGDWARIIRKLNRIGGLYIYRDGVRVLPYGNNDYDFLDIERNRTKSASYYYFSYRRIFGVIEIDREHNGQLQEKAGREGFRESAAYRQFRDILKRFFVQVAADFFREGSAQLGRYDEKRIEFSRLEKAKRRRDQQVSTRRNEFRERLTARARDLSDGRAPERVAQIARDCETNLRLAESEIDLDRAAAAFLAAESAARASLSEMRSEFVFTPPRGIGLPKSLRRDFDIYRTECEHFVTSSLEPALVKVESLVAAATHRSKAAIDRRRRFDQAIADVAEVTRKTTAQQGQEARTVADEVRERIGELARLAVEGAQKTVGAALAKAASLDVSTLKDAEFVQKRTELETEIEEAAADSRLVLTSIVERLRPIARNLSQPSGSQDDTSPADTDEAIDEELIALRERSEADLELAQLGIAVQIINHEFDATVRSIRRNIRQLHAWADANKKLAPLYESIRDNFSHLDGYLTLFTPLQRRLYRTAVKISGSDIQRFLEDLFSERFKRHEIEFVTTPSFRKFSVVGFPSTFYPVFVNLVDNAIYWTTQSSKSPKMIRLDVVEGNPRVSDSGPGIPVADRAAVFELGFTRKPAGRGLGLHISRDVLRRSGYSLVLIDDSSDLGGPAFEIRKDAIASPNSRSNS